MEAMRILKALDVKPRRTIRIALWSGEEQEELGSSGYVRRHFLTSSVRADDPSTSASTATDAKQRFAMTEKEEALDAYYNIDEGGGRVRGIYTQGNYAVLSSRSGLLR